MDGAMNQRPDIKLFILFLLNEINYPLDYATLSDVMMENGYVGSFDFTEIFSQLCEAGHITEIDDGTEKTYQISKTGQLVASELQDHILLSIREKSRKSAIRLLSLRRRGVTPSVRYEKRADGKYAVTCTLLEGKEILMQTVLAVSTEQEAVTIRTRFYQNPDTVLRGVMSVVSGELDYLLLN